MKKILLALVAMFAITLAANAADYRLDESAIDAVIENAVAVSPSSIMGEMNATIECTPLYGPFVVETIEKLQAGETLSKEVIHPEEGVFDMDGGIDVGGIVSVKAADVIDQRQY